MRCFILSIIAELLIMREQQARIKLIKRQIKLADFYDKHKNESYYSKDSLLKHMLIIKNL